MSSIRNDIKSALARKKMPQFAQGSMRDLGNKLGLPNPISLRSLDGKLADLPPAQLIFPSGQRVDGDVHGQASVGLQSDGSYSFTGEVWSKTGSYWLFVVALPEVKNSAGKVLCIANKGWVAGRGGKALVPTIIKFNVDGFDQSIADNWEAIGPPTWSLRSNTNPWQLTQTVLDGVVGFPVYWNP
jgi:hypothetical protein